MRKEIPAPVIAVLSENMPVVETHENALTILDTEEGEYRYNTLARAPNTDVLYVVHIEQDEETVRIISARLAEPSEQKQYFSGDFNE